MLTFAGSQEKQSHCFKFIGADSQVQSISLITGTVVGSNGTSLLISNTDDGFDTCSFYSGPSDSIIFAFSESTGSIADASYSSGFIGGYSGGTESCGSLASSSSSFSCSSASFSTCC